jgi:hypothetical protein
MTCEQLANRNILRYQLLGAGVGKSSAPVKQIVENLNFKNIFNLTEGEKHENS